MYGDVMRIERDRCYGGLTWLPYMMIDNIIQTVYIRLAKILPRAQTEHGLECLGWVSSVSTGRVDVVVAVH